MWIQALLAKDEERFFKRLELIASYNPHFEILIADYEEAKKKARQHGQLTQKDNDLLEIPAFFDGITMYLRPHEHLDLFDRSHMNEDNINTIYSFSKSKKMEQSELSILFNKSYIYSKASLTAFLQDLEGQLKNAALECPILFANTAHSVCLKYNKTKQKWFYIDTNDFGRYPDSATYFRELETTELVSSLFVSLSDSSAANVLFNTKVLSTTSQTKLDSIKESLALLDESYPVTRELATPCDSRKLGLLFLACQLGDLNLVQILLEHTNIKINQTNKDGATPLYNACFDGYLQVVAELLKHPNILINQADIDGTTALYLACYNGHSAIVAELLKHSKIEINQARSDGSTALYIACHKGHLAVVTELLKQPKIEINPARSNGVTPLYIACQNGHLDVVAALLTHPKIEINQATSNGVTPLLRACQKGHLAVITELLQHAKIEINQADSDGTTPLYIACQNGHLGIVTELLKQSKIEINQADSNGVTPLLIACQNGHIDVVAKLLKQSKILVNLGANNGVNPLYIACQQGHLAVITELLEQPKIEVNQARDGVTPLFMACQYNQLDVIELLLKTPGIDINSRGLANHTPLLVACLSSDTQNNEKLFQLLLNKGASLSHKNDKGQTALDIAIKQNNTAALSVLLKFIPLQPISPSALMSSKSLKKALCWAKAHSPAVAEYLVTYQSIGRIKFFTEHAKIEPTKDGSSSPRNGG
jgi:ankyrin repeat protein